MSGVEHGGQCADFRLLKVTIVTQGLTTDSQLSVHKSVPAHGPPPHLLLFSQSKQVRDFLLDPLNNTTMVQPSKSASFATTTWIFFSERNVGDRSMDHVNGTGASRVDHLLTMYSLMIPYKIHMLSRDAHPLFSYAIKNRLEPLPKASDFLQCLYTFRIGP